MNVRSGRSLWLSNLYETVYFACVGPLAVLLRCVLDALGMLLLVLAAIAFVDPRIYPAAPIVFVIAYGVLVVVVVTGDNFLWVPHSGTIGIPATRIDRTRVLVIAVFVGLAALQYVMGTKIDQVSLSPLQFYPNDVFPLWTAAAMVGFCAWFVLGGIEAHVRFLARWLQGLPLLVPVPDEDPGLRVEESADVVVDEAART